MPITTILYKLKEIETVSVIIIERNGGSYVAVDKKYIFK